MDPDQDISGPDPGEPFSKGTTSVPKAWRNGTGTDPKETERFQYQTRTDLFLYPSSFFMLSSSQVSVPIIKNQAQ